MSGYEQAARTKKAVDLFFHLKAAGISAATANFEMTEEHWRMVAQAARVNPPSTETIKLVVNMLSTAERKLNNPFPEEN